MGISVSHVDRLRHKRRRLRVKTITPYCYLVMQVPAAESYEQSVIAPQVDFFMECHLDLAVGLVEADLQRECALLGSSHIRLVNITFLKLHCEDSRTDFTFCLIGNASLTDSSHCRRHQNREPVVNPIGAAGQHGARMTRKLHFILSQKDRTVGGNGKLIEHLTGIAEIESDRETRSLVGIHRFRLRKNIASSHKSAAGLLENHRVFKRQIAFSAFFETILRNHSGIRHSGHHQPYGRKHHG